MDPARYVFNPSARCRGLALARDFSVDVRLPVRGLDGGVDFSKLLREVVTLLLELRDLKRGNPLDLLHAVSVRLFSGSRDGRQKQRVVLGQCIPMCHCCRQRPSVGEFCRLVGAIDPQTDRRVKLTLAGALAYFVMPIDLIPDFLPLVGFTDDAAVIAAALAAVSRSIRPEHREQARRSLDDA